MFLSNEAEQENINALFLLLDKIEEDLLHPSSSCSLEDEEVALLSREAEKMYTLHAMGLCLEKLGMSRDTSKHKEGLENCREYFKKIEELKSEKAGKAD